MTELSSDPDSVVRAADGSNMARFDFRTRPDFEDDAERAFQCNEAERDDEFWDTLRRRAGFELDTHDGQAVAARHRFTWQEALALSELSHVPRWWKKGGWLAWLSVSAAVALQWPGDERKQGVAADALISSSLIRAFTTLEFPSDREVEEDHPRIALLWRYPGIEELEHSFVYISRVDACNSDIESQWVTAQQVAQAHRVDAAGFDLWLGAIGAEPSTHIAAWLAASGVVSKATAADATRETKPMKSIVHKAERWPAGSVLARSTAAEVSGFSSAELLDALRQENIQKVRICDLLPKLIFRIAKESGFRDFQTARCPLSHEVILTWLEERCHLLALRRRPRGSEADVWCWYLEGLPLASEIEDGTVSSTPVNLNTFRTTRREAWHEAGNGVKRSR